METQYSFRRTEKKYLLSAEQYAEVTRRLSQRMQPDSFGRHTIASLYYDTPDYYLIRTSLEHPVYKEKLRLRAYTDTPLIFPEIKKKYKGVVYKRRIACTPEEWAAFHQGRPVAGQDMQIQQELHQMLCRYPDLAPRVLIAYDRTAYLDPESDLRVTFDENLRACEDTLLLNMQADGSPLLASGQVVMEVKFPGSAPLWLAHMLSECGVFPSSFSKYGHWYRRRCLHVRHNAG